MKRAAGILLFFSTHQNENIINLIFSRSIIINLMYLPSDLISPVCAAKVAATKKLLGFSNIYRDDALIS